MDRIVPWSKLESLIEPHCPKGENGRPPMGLGIMLPDLLHGNERKVWGDGAYQAP